MADEVRRSDLLIEMQKLREFVEAQMSRSREERRDQMADVSIRLQGIDSRLERVGGIVTSLQIAVAEESQKVKNIAAEVFHRRAVDKDGDAPAITRRDMRRLGAGIGLFGAMVLGLLQGTQWTLTLVQKALHALQSTGAK